jgi:hypothetical protein
VIPLSNNRHPGHPGRTGTRILRCIPAADRSRPGHTLLEEAAAEEADRILAAEGVGSRSPADERWGTHRGRRAGSWQVVGRRSQVAGILAVGNLVARSQAVGNLVAGIPAAGTRRILGLENLWLAVGFRSRERRRLCFRRLLWSQTVHHYRIHGRCRLRKTTGYQRVHHPNHLVGCQIRSKMRACHQYLRLSRLGFRRRLRQERIAFHRCHRPSHDRHENDLRH